MIRKISAALLASLSVTAIAKADLPSAPPSCVPYSFSGAYVGGTVGYGVGTSKFTGTRTGNVNIPGVGRVNIGASGKQNSSLQGINGGIVAGYGKVIGSPQVVYLGLNLEYLFDGAHGSNNVVVNSQFGNVGENLRVERRNDFNASARLGYVLNKTAMPFLQVGWSSANYKSLLTNVVTRVSSSETKRLNGLVVGAGVNMLVSSKVMAGITYTYTKYSKKSGSVLENSHNRIAMTVAYKFGN